MAISIKNIISIVIATIIAISMTPVIWDSIYTDALGCFAYNTSAADLSCYTGLTGSGASFCTSCMIGTSRTLLQLIPFIYVGAIIIGAIVVGYIKGKE